MSSPVAPFLPADAIAFIGGGHMARSLIAGLVAAGVAPASIRVAEPIPVLREGLERDFGVAAFAANDEAISGAGTWVLAIRPQALRPVCEAFAGPAREKKPLVVSIGAASVRSGALSLEDA